MIRNNIKNYINVNITFRKSSNKYYYYIIKFNTIRIS